MLIWAFAVCIFLETCFCMTRLVCFFMSNYFNISLTSGVKLHIHLWLGKKQWRKKDRINAGKTKIMICGTGLDLLQSSGEFLCAVCRTGVDSNNIFCNCCKHWVHKKCSGLKGLTKDPDYRCTGCQGTACPLDGRPKREVQVKPDKLEVVASFCYLGEMLSSARWTFNHNMCENHLEEVQELLPVLSSHHLCFKTHGRMYSSCA